MKKVLDEFSNPEEINDNPDSSPSKRIQRIFPEYNKVFYGSLIAQRIGIEKIREKCGHFDEWLSKLENL